MVEVLTSQVEELEQKLGDIQQLDRDITHMLYDLKHPVQILYGDVGYFAGHKIVGTQETLCYIQIVKQLKEEHPNLLAEKFRLWDCLSTHQKLIKKYQAIAEGVTHRGTYKHLNSVIRVYPKEGKVLQVLA